MHPSPVLSASLLGRPLSESLAEAFLPELDTWLDVNKGQLGDVLMGVSKPPLTGVSGAGPLAGFGSGGRLMWKWAGWESCDVAELPLSSPGPRFLLQLRGPQLFLINGPQCRWGQGVILRTAWCPQGLGSA